jgi:glycosyltransferase involved in cell wall biosynthesis
MVGGGRDAAAMCDLRSPAAAADANHPASGDAAGCGAMSCAPRRRLAVIVSHPIQYFAPLYQRLARRDDIDLRVFFTWHGGEGPVRDRGFAQDIAWDIPLTEGYAYETVPNTSRDAGTHHFFGLRNPSLVVRVAAWRPDAVIVHGWAWLSHLQALRVLPRRGIRTLLRGDSHLLDTVRSGVRWQMKKFLLTRFFAWPAGFLVAGGANRAYYEAFRVSQARLFPCPHSIDVARFAAPADAHEAEAARWRQELDIAPDFTVILYAGKFEPRKCPIELVRAVVGLERRDTAVVLVGAGELQGEVEAIAAAHPRQVRVLPFQNQSRMPIVYRLGDLFVLPSAYGESWGLAVNEALACGRPVLVSDRVGCAADLVDSSCGRVFAQEDPAALMQVLRELTSDRTALIAMREAASKHAALFDVAVSEHSLVAAMETLCGR